MSLNTIPPNNILNNLELNADGYSSAVEILFTDNIGLQFVWTGTPAGTFSAQVSNTPGSFDPISGTTTGAVWSDFTISGMPTPAGTAGDKFLQTNQLAARLLRIKYTAVSGDGHCTCSLVGKPV